MGRGTDCENVWFRARKKAASYNDKLNSREGASEAIGIAPSTLAEYELGITKCIPPDKAVLMADVYKAPELMSWYCNHECPIGCATAKKPEEVGGIEQVAIALLNGLSLDDLAAIRQKIIEIACDGEVDDDEQIELEKIVQSLDSARLAIARLGLFVKKNG